MFGSLKKMQRGDQCKEIWARIKFYKNLTRKNLIIILILFLNIFKNILKIKNILGRSQASREDSSPHIKKGLRYK